MAPYTASPALPHYLLPYAALHHLRLISLATRRENMAILLTAADRLNLSATAQASYLLQSTLQDFIPVNQAPNASADP